MTKPHKKRGNPDFAHRVSPPAPSNETIEASLRDLMTPGTFANLIFQKNSDNKNKTWRNRILTLPVMAAIVLSLVYRQVNHLTDVLRLLSHEGLLWAEPVSVTKQALSRRLMTMPAEWFRQMFNDVASRLREKANPTSLTPAQQNLCKRFPALWLADGSTLERLQRKMGSLHDLSKAPLAGKIMMVVAAFSKRPIAAWYEEEANTHDRNWQVELLNTLPVNGLLVFDLGFFEFDWFDRFTETERWFITRQRSKTTVKVVKILAQTNRYRDELVQVGSSKDSCCKFLLRQVSVVWKGKWYSYLTNVLDPEMLSAEEVVQLYRQRWKIEDAFRVTKRLLGLAYFWVSNSNGVQIQVYATLLFYAVLTDLCSEVAIALNRDIGQISEEMVFRGLYFYSRARERNPEEKLIPYFVAQVKLLGLVKARRAKHLERETLNSEIWDLALS